MITSAQREATAGNRGQGGVQDRRPYAMFAAMIVTSTVTMFLLTYTNAYTWSHMTFSQERVYMALIMGAAMTPIMLAFMRVTMYRDRSLNRVIVVAAVVIGAAGLWLSRTQTLVDDTAYMRGMIPHHSIAILTSERAAIDDLRVRELADGITATQLEEIAEMAWLIDDIHQHGVAATPEQALERPVPEFTAEP
jgi:uncharacterized protein (DUF305 family)